MSLSLLCLYKHVPDRRRVRFDNYQFCAPCRNCGKRMVKGDKGWRLRNADIPHHDDNGRASD